MNDIKFKNREAVRGALCTLSRKSGQSGESIPAHINKIDHLSKKFGLTSSAKDILNELHKIGEVCNLTNGYWLPSPSRLVNFNIWDIIISTNPTDMLEKHLDCKIYTNGIGRFCEKLETNLLPYESFKDWANIPDNITKWTKNKISIANQNISPLSIDASNCKIYCPWLLSEICVYTNRNSYWKPLTSQKIPDSISFVLFKESITQSFRSGILFVDKGKIQSKYEGIPSNERIRFMCGLDILYNVKKKYRIIRKDNDYQTLQLVRPLPTEEEKLFATICEKRDGKYPEYNFPTFLYPAIEKILLGLGYEKHANI